MKYILAFFRFFYFLGKFFGETFSDYADDINKIWEEDK